MPKKTKLYNELLDRQNAALKADFHFESCWFAHAIFEDRTRSIVSNSGDGKGFGGTMSEKLRLILQRWDEVKPKKIANKTKRDKRSGNKIKIPKWPHLHTIERRLIEDVQQWTKDRNRLAHRLASGEFTLVDADLLIKQLSVRGMHLTKEICSSARRVKKRPKEPSPN